MSHIFPQGVLIAGYGSGHVRLFGLAGANILCEVSAHNGWITGMDLASQSGLLLTCAEDSYVRVWQLNTKGALVEHWFSHPVQDSLMAGAKFMDPRGSSFCISSYDSTQIKVRRVELVCARLTSHCTGRCLQCRENTQRWSAVISAER